MAYERNILKKMLRFGALCDDNHREYSPTSIVKDEIHADITESVALLLCAHHVSYPREGLDGRISVEQYTA
ncbi:hypothetical protein Krac_1336 [Ktedonobacter racemifer DSM 44963]|uniref:Uncharacterized protein n=1 Tax=Ktedonobacter racemifer DSM 44963 TaxID=485913 RepID=D6U6V9_KTERA|nr:hypothetical protein Krac_1336 [Ktedonobacter racemifer DSM 44963]